MTCPDLKSRNEANGEEFDVERAYCTETGEFVEPIRADICNDRYNLAHNNHSESFPGHEKG